MASRLCSRRPEQLFFASESGWMRDKKMGSVFGERRTETVESFVMVLIQT